MAEVIKVDIVADAGRFTPEVAKATAGLTKFQAASGSATRTMIDFGRVLQDAPFGFIGIANNLNPLVEGFGRLKKEAGSTGGAFKALAGQLIGPAGIGFALSALTAIISFSTIGFGAWTRGLGDSSKATKELKDETNATEQAIKAYDEAVRNASSSTLAQQEQIEDLNRTLVDSTNKYNHLTATVISNALANLLASQKEGLLKKALELEIKKAEDAFKKANPFSDVREFSPDLLSNDKVKKEAAEISADLTLLNNKIRALGLDGLIKSIFTPDVKSKKVKDEVDKLGKTIGKIKPIELDVKLAEPFSIASKGTEAFSKKLVSAIEVEFRRGLIDLEEITKKLLSDFSFGVFEQLGTSIGTAIATGANPIKEAFTGIFELFGDAIIELGRNAILFSKAFIALQAALKAGGITGIVAGIGLIALGTLIKGAASKLSFNGFAVGTRNAPGGLALVGERGPELVNIPQGSRVTPAAQTAAALNGMGDSIRVYGVMRGRDIYFTNKRYGNTFNTTT